MLGGVWLTLKRRSANQMEYSVALGYRVLFAAIALVILLALFSGAERSLDASNWLAYVFLGLSLFASLYTEQWLFDTDRDVLEYRIGLVFWSRLRQWALDDLEALELRRTRLAGRREITALELRDDQGQHTKIDMVRGSAAERLATTAQDISEFCGLPVEDERGESEEDDARAG